MWKQRLQIWPEGDDIYQLARAQVIIFRLRTGQCQLFWNLFRLKIFHTDECPCGTDPQMPYHILQSCPIVNTMTVRNMAQQHHWGTWQTWPTTPDYPWSQKPHKKGGNRTWSLQQQQQTSSCTNILACILWVPQVLCDHWQRVNMCQTSGMTVLENNKLKSSISCMIIAWDTKDFQSSTFILIFSCAILSWHGFWDYSLICTYLQFWRHTKE